MLALLLERGAKVEEQHYLGTTALHFAARVGAVEMAELLLDHGADIDRKGRKFDASGQTPLECALERDQHEFASFLLQKGARPAEGA
jgi:ankyrin repeat protein